MAWTFDDSRASGTPGIPSAAMNKYYAWRRFIRDHGKHPKDAASDVGDLDYKLLRGTDAQYQIRLNQEHRVTFTVDSANERVTVLQIGGHT